MVQHYIKKQAPQSNVAGQEVTLVVGTPQIIVLPA
jgi:hypothetical protein